ncbi:DUF1707 domain-containing protein [Gordonia sp. zg691]|uniref:DUF1707 domain-containing protein n=1 Tax=Gordonia jinghuaiqii TaxID=2758710 RepID=A0A7D7LSM3_9ACTN|nr:DUF1707 domain-containing protein [Gordonia jinghuaiqii]MBD0859648.1 DUF1707 domain-containing protein [Gordonia jinghuaiqii]MCR5976873.1 DUF1707 domain-containing protein [Gordonia jinghuaiqii]QMT00501.1 DUF1707 domain-containing protein [Gordonia jinghuaiqii]
MVDRLPDDELRVGNPERERAITLLNDAFSSGYLEIAEFEERSGLVYSARTRGELRVVLEHLPNAGLLFIDAAVAPVHAAPQQTMPPLHLEAEWESVRRKGTWQVPFTIIATGTMGKVDLDFTNASFPGPSTSLQLQVSATTVKVRVGPDQEVRYGGLQLSGWSKVKDKAGAQKRPGGPVIEISGSASGMTAVVIRRS